MYAMRIKWTDDSPIESHDFASFEEIDAFLEAMVQDKNENYVSLTILRPDGSVVGLYDKDKGNTMAVFPKGTPMNTIWEFLGVDKEEDKE